MGLAVMLELSLVAGEAREGGAVEQPGILARSHSCRGNMGEAPRLRCSLTKLGHNVESHRNNLNAF
jgi:hypothetical protein